jgi:hypothetical protein
MTAPERRDWVPPCGTSGLVVVERSGTAWQTRRLWLIPN